MKTIKATRNGRPATPEELQCAVEGKPLPATSEKPWFLWGQRELSLLDKIKLLLGWKLYVRFDSPYGNCSAACDLSHQITRAKYEQVKWHRPKLSHCRQTATVAGTENMNESKPIESETRGGSCAPAPCSAKFKVGDIAEATAKIWRKDGRSELQPGDQAKVREVWQTTPDSPQIIGLEIKGKLPMGGIVCFENVPLRIVFSPNVRVSESARENPTA